MVSVNWWALKTGSRARLKGGCWGLFGVVFELEPYHFASILGLLHSWKLPCLLFWLRQILPGFLEVLD